jgi:hypothetical protein
VQQSSLYTGAVDDSGFEIVRHDFELTDRGKGIAQQKRDQNPDTWEKIESVVTRLKQGGDIDYMKMSIAAKPFFMLSEKGKHANTLELSEPPRNLVGIPSFKESTSQLISWRNRGWLQ